MNAMWRSVGLVALVAGAAACGGDDAPTRADVVASITDDAVAARYAEFDAAAAGLGDAVDDWCAGGPADAVVTQVAGVRSEWLELVPFWFGPVDDRRSVFIVDPRVNVEDVDELAAGVEPVDATSLRDLAGADQRGLGAVEHLAAGEASERACEYASGATALVVEEGAALADEWTSFGPTLAGSEEQANDSLRDIVSGALRAIEMAGEEPGTPGAAARLAGARWVLLGDGNENSGLAPLLADSTVEQLTAEFDAADAMALERTIVTEVVGELGISVNFSDADGDG